MDIKKETAKILEAAYAEDIGSGDVTGNYSIPANSVGTYAFRARGEMVFCGIDAILHAFPHAKVYARDGAKITKGFVIAEVNGNTRDILAKERSVLNLIHILSGIATETAKYVKAVEGTKVKILDTRKTIPGLRVLSKYAVKCGGGQNHRIGLYDMVMIKDNHIESALGIKNAVEKARASGLKIEVEVDNISQVQEVLDAKADIILADNMPPEQLKEVVALVNGKMLVEASGNVNLQTVRAIAETGVDYISTSKITMAATPVDIGLDEV